MIASIFAISVNAKALEQQKLLDNVEISIDGGVLTPLNSFEKFSGMAGVEISKGVTPITRLGIEGELMFDMSKYFGNSDNVVDNAYVGVYMATNWMNLVNGYKGDPQKFEIETLVGAGWMHGLKPGPYNYNGFGMRTGVNLNYNVNEMFKISLKPSILWESYKFDSSKSAMVMQVGLTYKFKNHDGRRSFTLCNKVATQEEVDKLNDKINKMRKNHSKDMKGLKKKYNELMAENQSLLEQVNQFKQHTCPTLPEKTLPQIGFKVGSSELQETSYVTLNEIAKEIINSGAKYQVFGYASIDGGEKINMELSQKRAEVVMDALIKLGVPEDRIEAVAMGETDQFSKESLVLNRVVVTRK